MHHVTRSGSGRSPIETLEGRVGWIVRHPRRIPVTTLQWCRMTLARSGPHPCSAASPIQTRLDYNHRAIPTSHRQDGDRYICLSVCLSRSTSPTDWPQNFPQASLTRARMLRKSITDPIDSWDATECYSAPPLCGSCMRSRDTALGKQVTAVLRSERFRLCWSKIQGELSHRRARLCAGIVTER
jgi:hypothetical protein